ncbi:MAG: SRPBCC family protein [Bryobacteraceae bacterium]
MMSAATLEIFSNRWFNAPATLVFRAFTEPALLERWFCPSPEVALRVEQFNPQPGGAYRFVFYFPDGRKVPVIGEYRIVEPPQRLVFTWTWEPPDPWAGLVTLVEVNFLPRDSGTFVEVHHVQLATADMKEMHEAGWVGTLARLDELLGKMSDTV